MASERLTPDRPDTIVDRPSYIADLATEESLRLLAAHVPAVMSFQDAELRYRSVVNPPAPLGVDAFLGRTDDAIFTPAEAESLKRIKRKVLATGTGRRATVTLRVGGRDRCYVLTVEPSRTSDGQIDGIFGYLQDVTAYCDEVQRQRFLNNAASALAESLDLETTLNQVARLAVPDLADLCAVQVYGTDGMPYQVAVASRDPTQVERARDMDRRYPATVERKNPIALAIAAGQPLLYPEVTEAIIDEIPEDEEFRRWVKDVVRPRSLLAVALQARGRTFGSLALVMTDSGRRLGREHLAIVTELARRAALAIDNAIMYHRAQEAIQARDMVLTSASHDLRGPLAAIGLTATGLRQEVAQAGPPRRKALGEGLRQIDARVQEIDDQIVELVDAGHLQSGEGLWLQRQPTDLVALARRLVGEYQRSTRDHYIRLDASVPHLVGTWDRARLERVVGNLLSNAIKYSPAGAGIEVRVRCEESRKKRWAILEVRDHGVGIPTAELSRVFSWFYRASNVANRVAGSGIGLAGAARIIAQHGGTVDVDSQEGQGSTFTVRLPVSDAEAAPQALGH